MSRTVNIFKPFPLFHQLVWLYRKRNLHHFQWKARLSVPCFTYQLL